MPVEACVENNSKSGVFLDLFKQLPVAGILAIQDLRTKRAILAMTAATFSHISVFAIYAMVMKGEGLKS